MAENAAWAYEEPYREAETIRGYLSFYRSKISALYEGEQEAPPVGSTVEGLHGNPLANWLLKDAWKAGSSAELAEQFLTFLRAAGYPVDRSTVIMPTLHPQIFATVLVWRADTPVRSTSTPGPYDCSITTPTDRPNSAVTRTAGQRGFGGR
jgi:hypothetical protein